MKVEEYLISGYPREWDSINIRDMLVMYGSIIRIRSNQNSNPRLQDSISRLNPRLKVKSPDRFENFKFDSIPPHCTAYNIRTGFVRWIDDQPHFIEKDEFYSSSLMLSTSDSIHLHLWKENTKYKLALKFRNIIRISCKSQGDDYEVFLQLNQPPEIYRNDQRGKGFQFWTIGCREPSWTRTLSIFDDLKDLLSFEVKKLGIKLSIKKIHNDRMIEFLESIQSFCDFPETIDLPSPMTFADIESCGLSFQVKFLVYSLISLTLVSVYDLTKEFLLSLRQLDQDRVAKTLNDIVMTHSSMGTVTIAGFMGMFMQDYESNESFEMPVPEGYEQINRVLITPSTYYLRVGEPELSNRVTRQYQEYKEDFLRITFIDENLNKILPYPEELLSRVARALDSFNVAGKTFKVLAYSASQLKQHSVWMLNVASPVRHSEIYRWLGDFSSIRVKGKFVARIGLSFSSSKRILDLEPSEIEMVHDITCNGYNFSDGIGMISKELVDDINKIAGTNACAFQFRLGGAKGVACLDDRLQARKLCLRESMVKYPSTLLTFELLNPSEFRYGFLNRQLIMLLNTLGTPSDTFIKLHHEMLQNIEDDCKNFFSCMKAMNPGNLSMQCLHHLMACPNEPLAHEIKSLLLKRSLHQLRQKQKIFLKKSGCLMGVIDEKNVLSYGQCFLQVPEGPVQGPVIVAKNPCLHPGDIRVLEAVSQASLSHLHNVLVFPSSGPRPHTNECSGSDLDGDLYFVSWEPRLIPPSTQDPMTYDSIPPLESSDRFNHKTLIDFFQTFVTNDKLGQIDNLHLAVADSSPDYANDPACIRLSELHAVAVDFAKTGNVVQIPKEFQNLPFPDFMEHAGETYESEKILGLLYRDVKEIPEFEIPELQANNLVQDYEEDLVLARKLVFGYKKDLEILMKRFGVSCEVELIIAQPLELTNYFQKKKREDELRELLNMNSNRLVEKHRALFMKHASTQLASACYFVSHKEAAVRAYPWVVTYEYLIAIDKE